MTTQAGPSSGRVRDVWGPRTPHGPGDTWPTRVDLHLTERTHRGGRRRVDAD